MAGVESRPDGDLASGPLSLAEFLAAPLAVVRRVAPQTML
jgi:hypothetical protein